MDYIEENIKFPKMKKILIITVIILGLVLAFYYGLRVGIFLDTQYVLQACEGRKSIHIAGGRIQTANCYINKEISILTEEKKCEEMGGEFDIQGDWSETSIEMAPYYLSNGMHVPNYDEWNITCTSPAKELFRYEVDN